MKGQPRQGCRIARLGAGNSLGHAGDPIDNIADGLYQQAFSRSPFLVPPSQPSTQSHPDHTTGKCGNDLHREGTIPSRPAGTSLSQIKKP